MPPFRNIDAKVLEYFARWLDRPQGSMVELTGTAGMEEPHMARQHFLFHTARDALCFCQLHIHLLDRPGNNVFTAIRLRPTAARLLELKSRFPNARTVGVFDDDLCGRVLDCKVALWQTGRDASFIWGGGEVAFTYRDRTFRVPEPRFSLHRFRTLTGMRSTYCTLKPKGFVSFAAMLAHS